MTTNTYCQYTISLIQNDDGTVEIIAVNTQTRTAYHGTTTLRNALATIANNGVVGMIGYALSGKIGA